MLVQLADDGRQAGGQAGRRKEGGTPTVSTHDIRMDERNGKGSYTNKIGLFCS